MGLVAHPEATRVAQQSAPHPAVAELMRTLALRDGELRFAVEPRETLAPWLGSESEAEVLWLLSDIAGLGSFLQEKGARSAADAVLQLIGLVAPGLTDAIIGDSDCRWNEVRKRLAARRQQGGSPAMVVPAPTAGVSLRGLGSRSWRK